MRFRWFMCFAVGAAISIAAAFTVGKLYSASRLASIPSAEHLPPALSYEQARDADVSPEVTPPPAQAKPQPHSQDVSSSLKAAVPTPTPLKEPQKAALPAEINLSVPFTSQAPHANWELPYQETCEEASMLMVARYKKAEPVRSPEDADAAIRAIVEAEKEFFGYYEDTTAEETVQFAKQYYGFKNSRVVYDFTLDGLKREVAKGNPVILPAAGRILPNPYFRSPGPLYHMLVVRGYTKDGRIITNDPGTKRGEQFVYQPDALLNAVHDWNGGDVLNGKKVMIVLE